MAAKTGSLIFLHGKMTVLLMLLRAIEKYSYVKTFGVLQLQEKGASDSEIDAFKIFIENDIDFFKKQSIKAINGPIPEYLKVLEHFDTWDEYLIWTRVNYLNSRFIIDTGSVNSFAYICFWIN